jgi:hypothetical protein
MSLPALLMLAAAVAPISDADLKAYAARGYDKAEKMFKHDQIGLHHGVMVVVDFPCSDVCPAYTRRIIHYAVEPGPACDKIGGVVQMMAVPVSIAVTRKPFCVPKILAEGSGTH